VNPYSVCPAVFATPGYHRHHHVFIHKIQQQNLKKHKHIKRRTYTTQREHKNKNRFNEFTNVDHICDLIFFAAEKSKMKYQIDCRQQQT